MPSTTSSCVSSVFDSSTVMTPSLPTFFMASAMILPMVSSLLAEMVPTWLIMLSLLTGFENLSSSPLTRLPSLSILPQMVVTAFSMPRLRAMGLAPAATVLTPSRKIAWARTVAVVVPSPATSEVLLATSRTIWAPMFSRPSFSSISLATVTPSLVMVGEPNFFSITTLRPLGPSVPFTASARRLTPRRIAWRDSSPCTICFAICFFSYFEFSSLNSVILSAAHFAARRISTKLLPALKSGSREPKLLARPGGFLLPDAGRAGGSGQDAEDFVFFHNDEVFAINLDLGAGVLAEQDAVVLLHGEREGLAFIVGAAFAGRYHDALLRFVFCAVGDDDAAAGGGSFLHATYQNAVM